MYFLIHPQGWINEERILMALAILEILLALPILGMLPALPILEILLALPILEIQGVFFSLGLP